MFVGIGIILVMMFGWFGIKERSEDNLYNTQVVSFRMGMIWFIFFLK
jgi:hypothetical protein